MQRFDPYLYLPFLHISTNYQTSAMAQERQKKTSLTQLVHSTIGLSLVTQEGETPLPEIANREETMASRLQFNSKSGAGSVSSDKVALTECDDVSSLDRGRRQRPTKTLINQASQDGWVARGRGRGSGGEGRRTVCVWNECKAVHYASSSISCKLRVAGLGVCVGSHLHRN